MVDGAWLNDEQNMKVLRDTIVRASSPQLSSVKLQFVTDPGIGSRLIRWWEGPGADYSHVDLVLPDGQLLGARDSKIGNVPAGVQVRPAGYKAFSKVLVATLPCTEDQAKAIYAAAMSQVGKPYAYEQIWDFVSHDLDPAPTASSKSWICDVFVYWAISQGGVYLLNRKVNPNELTPQNLLFSPLLNY